MIKKTAAIGIVFLFFITNLSGCVENNSESKDIDLTTVKLTLDDLKQDFQKISEEHVTDPYVVQEGKLFEGLKVIEKYEVLFLENETAFLKQQIAQLQSSEKSKTFIDTLRSETSIPGIQDSWNFSSISIETIGDDSVLKQNKTVIGGNDVTIFLLAFRIDNIVNIFASSYLSKEDILEYGMIVEARINKL